MSKDYCFICNNKKILNLTSCPKCSTICCYDCLKLYYISKNIPCYCKNTKIIDDYIDYLIHQDMRHYIQTFDIIINKETNVIKSSTYLNNILIFNKNIQNIYKCLDKCELNDKNIINSIKLIENIIYKYLKNNSDIYFINKCSKCNNYRDMNLSNCLKCNQKYCKQCFLVYHTGNCKISRMNYLNTLINSIKPCPNCLTMNIYLVNMKDIIWCNKCKISYNQVTGKEIVLNPPDIGDNRNDYKKKIEQINNINSNDLKFNMINIKNKILLNNDYNDNNDNTKSVNQFIAKINQKLKDIPNELKINIKESIDTKSMNNIIINDNNDNITKEYKNIGYIIYEFTKVLGYLFIYEKDLKRYILPESKEDIDYSSLYYIIETYGINIIPKIDHIIKYIDSDDNITNNIHLVDKSDKFEIPDIYNLIKKNDDLYNKLDNNTEFNISTDKVIEEIINLYSRITEFMNKLDELINLLLKVNNRLNNIKFTDDNNNSFEFVIICLKTYFGMNKSISGLSKICDILNDILGCANKFINISINPINIDISNTQLNIDDKFTLIIKNMSILIKSVNMKNRPKIIKLIIKFNELFDLTTLPNKLNIFDNRPKIDISTLYIKYKYINTAISKLIIQRINKLTKNSNVKNYIIMVIAYINTIYSYNLKNKYDSSKCNTILDSRTKYMTNFTKFRKKHYLKSLYINNQSEIRMNRFINIYLVSANMCQYILYQNNWNNIDDICIFISEIEYIFTYINKVINDVTNYHWPYKTIENIKLDLSNKNKYFNLDYHQ